MSAFIVVVFAASQGRETLRLTAWRTPTAILLLLAAAVGLIAWGAGLDVGQDRWHRLLAPQGETTLSNRLMVDRAGAAGLSRAGWFGEGPGTFPAIFPALQQGLPDAPDGQWLAAHNDYLQTALEWGVIGCMSWSVYLFGALFALLWGLRRRRWRTLDRGWALGLVLALVGVAAMALVDFPLQVASLDLNVAVLAGLAWSSFSWPQARACPT